MTNQTARDEYVKQCYEAEAVKPNGMAATWAYRLQKEREFDALQQTASKSEGSK